MITIGLHSYMDGVKVYYENEGDINIGRFTGIAPGTVLLLGGRHNRNNISQFPFSKKIYKGCKETEPSMAKYGNINIGSDVWIGMNCFIFGGVNIGDGAVVGACSLVKKDIPDYEIWCGNPAKKIGDRFPERVKKILQDMLWWYWDEDKLNGAIPLLTSNKIDELVEYASRS